MRLTFPEPVTLKRLAAPLCVFIFIVVPRAILHLFQVNHVLLLFRLPRHLRLLELELAVVHDPNDGRPSHRRDFHQIESLRLCLREGRLQVENSELSAVGRNHAERADADLSVHAYALGAVLNGRSSLKKGTCKIADTYLR